MLRKDQARVPCREAGKAIREKECLAFGEVEGGEEMSEEVEDAGNGRNAGGEAERFSSFGKAYSGWVP
jgi:hypothetical protein